MDKIPLAKRQELVCVLEILCEQLELTETQRESAEEKYRAVGKWLNVGGTVFAASTGLGPESDLNLVWDLRLCHGAPSRSLH
jgi:hypothetical protein